MIRQVIIPRGEVEAAGGRDAVEDPFAGDGVARPTVEGAQRGEMRLAEEELALLRDILLE